MNNPHLTVRQYYILKYSQDAEEILTVISELTGGSVKTITAAAKFVEEVLAAVQNALEANLQLQIPNVPNNHSEKHHFTCFTNDIKIVSDYTRLNFMEVYNMDYLMFRSCLHDAVVWHAMRNKSGKDFLEEAWALMQTKPDRKALREAKKNGK